MDFTDRQLQAITSNGTNILVSAGAGSGKTRVLTQRVYSHIKNDGFNIDEMLILTFTNAAASEMKNRIRDRIVNDEELTNKQTQINKLDSSYIMTFDAYSLFLVKKYHQLLKIDKNINIIDSNIISLKTKEIIEDIFNNEYVCKNKDFIKLIDDLCLKNDDDIKEALIKLNDKLNQIYDRNNYISNYVDNYYSDTSINNDFNKYVLILKDIIKDIDNKLNEISQYVDVDSIFINYRELINANTYEDIINALNVYDTNSLPRGSELKTKELKDSIKNSIDKLRKLTRFTKTELINNVLNSKDNTICLLRLVEVLNKRINEYKVNNNLYEFIDIAKLAIKLLDEHQDIKNEIKTYFKEILIDEYQDTNDIQDEFIRRISNNNVYMVGDIKQSIYRFRNANPSLFKDKYNAYKNNDGGILIELPDNFRSRSEVLENINTIFNRLMDSNIGGVDYLDGHQMKAGFKEYKENTDDNMSILTYKYFNDKENNIDYRNIYPFDTLKQNEVEAIVIAKDINDKIKNKFNVYDLKTNCLRPCRYDDFAIILDRGTDFDLIKQILTYNQIPCVIKQEEKLNSSDLLTVIKSSFRLLCALKDNDNEYEFKYAFVSIARSFISDLNDNDIYEIVKNKTYKDSDLYKKYLNILDDIEYKSISDILDELIKTFDIYTRINKIGDVSNNLVKLDYLYELANNLSNVAYNYKSFNSYLNDIFESDNDIKFNINSQDENAVVLTNIHKSKGLEYKICYFGQLYKDFNTSDVKQRILFSKQFGLIIPTYIENKGLLDSFRSDLYKHEYTLKDIDEKIRLLYVALTRTREKMILVTPLIDNDCGDHKLVSDYSRTSIKCFNDLLSYIYDDLKDYINEINYDNYAFNKDYLSNSNDVFKNIKGDGNNIELKQLKEYVPELVNKSSYSKSPGLISVEQIKAMSIGSKVHKYLELLDLNNPDYSLIDNDCINKIKDFINSELMLNKDKAIMHKEYEFIYNLDNEIKHGFIDLMMEYDDHIDIIDYKLSNIDDDNYDKQLLGYKDYIKSISNKEVNCYLYSINTGEIRRIEDGR